MDKGKGLGRQTMSTDEENGGRRSISYDAVVAVVTNLRQSPATDLCCDEVGCTRTSVSLCPHNPRPSARPSGQQSH